MAAETSTCVAGASDIASRSLLEPSSGARRRARSFVRVNIVNGNIALRDIAVKDYYSFQENSPQAIDSTAFNVGIPSGYTPRVRTVGKNIEQIRERLGLSQEELAGLMGAKQAAISKLENQTGMPRGGTLMKVATALKVSVETLVAGIDKDYDALLVTFSGAGDKTVAGDLGTVSEPIGHPVQFDAGKKTAVRAQRGTPIPHPAGAHLDLLSGLPAETRAIIANFFFSTGVALRGDARGPGRAVLKPRTRGPKHGSHRAGNR